MHERQISYMAQNNIIVVDAGIRYRAAALRAAAREFEEIGFCRPRHVPAPRL